MIFLSGRTNSAHYRPCRMGKCGACVGLTPGHGRTGAKAAQWGLAHALQDALNRLILDEIVGLLRLEGVWLGPNASRFTASGACRAQIRLLIVPAPIGPCISGQAD